jgi:hypothetical protein
LGRCKLVTVGMLHCRSVTELLLDISIHSFVPW